VQTLQSVEIIISKEKRMRRAVRNLSVCVVVVMVAGLLPVLAQDSGAASRLNYKKPPKVIADVLESPATPTAIPSPTRDRLLVIDSLRHPPIADLAAPMLRLAGVRINPATNGRHHPPRHIALRLVTITDGKEQKLAVPAGAYLSLPEWAADGKHFAFTNTVTAGERVVHAGKHLTVTKSVENGIELWVGDAATGALKQIPHVRLNAVYGDALQWMPDQRTLLVQLVPAGRGKPPEATKVPNGPNVQESAGKAAPIPTFEDMLQNPHDEDLFDYYAAAQLALVDIQSGRVTVVGKPAIFERADASPDGKHLLIARLRRPYSYLLPAYGFPKEVEVWDRSGNVEYKLASLPSDEGVPLEGVPTGPRNYEWRPTQPATLVWAEALDGGDVKKAAPFRDRVLMLSAPFTGQPAEMIRLEYRLGGGRRMGGSVTWGEKGLVFVSDYDRNKRWIRTFLLNADDPGEKPKQVWSRSVRDRYADPGSPLMRILPNGQRVTWQNGNSIYLRGEGSSPKGDRPFLDRFDLTTFKSDRLFQSGEKVYEAPVALLADDASKFVTRFESPTDPPNYFVRTAGNEEKRRLTSFPDPAPQLRGITKQLVTYKRADGVGLSFTLYLPPDYKPGTKLPTVVWAYPLEFNDAATASQVSGSQYRFTTIGGISHLFLLTQGYAVLDNATMPVVGDPETMNETYVEQIVASAKAAIDKAVEMGVADPNRVGVGGHSYGAFMTANLLAHSELFKAGVARSGAYNRTLTPFGFQSERRTFWEAPDMYVRVSPFRYADKIKRPILLIHGEADDNSGTFPIQSERMYQAIKGNGGVVRYVTLPNEAHGYQALESVEHVQWEMINWFDKWVKNAPEAAVGK
jgi:dipeptidyl aminopeptidase/acylaminoacyl peptidase